MSCPSPAFGMKLLVHCWSFLLLHFLTEGRFTPRALLKKNSFIAVSFFKGVCAICCEGHAVYR